MVEVPDRHKLKPDESSGIWHWTPEGFTARTNYIQSSARMPTGVIILRRAPREAGIYVSTLIRKTVTDDRLGGSRGLLVPYLLLPY